MAMPRVPSRLRVIALGVLIVASLFALVTYRGRYLPTLDETGGGWDGLIVAVVDVGLVCGVTALLTVSLLWSLFAWSVGWISLLAERRSGGGDAATDTPDPPAEITRLPFRVPFTFAILLLGWVFFFFGICLIPLLPW
jgi:hypothetical protein